MHRAKGELLIIRSGPPATRHKCLLPRPSTLISLRNKISELRSSTITPPIWRVEAFTIEPRPIEAANTSLPGSEHRAGIVDPTRASLWSLGGGDPVDPISARDGRDVRPQLPRFRGGRESLPQICRHPGFRFLSRRCDLQRDDVACVCARSFAHLPVHSEPVASLAVWLEGGSKGAAIDGAFDRRHARRGGLATGVLW